MRLSADLPPSGFDGGLRTLSNAANHSVLWMVSRQAWDWPVAAPGAPRSAASSRWPVPARCRTRSSSPSSRDAARPPAPRSSRFDADCPRRARRRSRPATPHPRPHSPPPSRSNTPPPALRSHRSPRQSRTRACTPACTGRPTSRSVPVSAPQSPSLRGDGGQCGTRSPRRWDRIARRRRWSRATAWSCSSPRVRQRRRRRPYRGRAGAAQGSDRRVRR